MHQVLLQKNNYLGAFCLVVVPQRIEFFGLCRAALRAFVDYMSECEHGPVFPIGGLGDGSIVFLDLESGRVQGYNCDYSNLEEIANSFSSLLLSLVEQALEIGKLCGES